SARNRVPATPRHPAPHRRCSTPRRTRPRAPWTPARATPVPGSPARAAHSAPAPGNDGAHAPSPACPRGSSISRAPRGGGGSSPRAPGRTNALAGSATSARLRPEARRTRDRSTRPRIRPARRPLLQPSDGPLEALHPQAGDLTDPPGMAALSVHDDPERALLVGERIAVLPIHEHDAAIAEG